MSEKQLWDQLDETIGEVGALRLVVIHLLAENARTAGRPEEWLRTFADKIHGSIDRSPVSSVTHSKLELLRSNIDELMLSAQRRL